MDASFLSIIEKTILNTSSEDKLIREPAVKDLSTLMDSSPDQYVKAMVSMITFSKESKVQLYCLITLRHEFIDTEKMPSLVFKISGETYQWLKNEFIKYFLDSSLPREIHNQLAYCLGEMGSVIIEKDASKWPELLPTLFEWTKNPNVLVREGALLVFSEIVYDNAQFFLQHVPILINIIELALKDKQSEVVPQRAIQAAASMLKAVGQKRAQLTQFKRLAPMMMEVLGASLTSGNYESTTKYISLMIDVCNAKAAFFEDILTNTVDSMIHIIDTAVVTEATEITQRKQRNETANVPIDTPVVVSDSMLEKLGELRNIAVEFAVVLAVAFKKRMMKTDFYQRFTACLTKMMYLVKESSDWTETDEDDDPENVFDVVIAAFHRVSCAFEKHTKTVHLPIVGGMLVSADLKQRWFALVQLAAIIPGLSQCLSKENIKTIVTLVCDAISSALAALSSSPSPLSSTPLDLSSAPSTPSAPFDAVRSGHLRIMCGAFCVVKSLSDQVKNFVGSKKEVRRCGAAVLSALNSPSAQLKPFPRVAKEGIDALLELAECAEKETMEALMNDVMKAAADCITTPDEKYKSARNKAFSLLSATAEKVKGSIAPLFDTMSGFLMPFVAAKNVESADDRECQGNAIDCMMTLMKAVGKEQAAECVVPFTQVLIGLSEEIKARKAAAQKQQQLEKAQQTQMLGAPTAERVPCELFDSREDMVRATLVRLIDLLGPRGLPLVQHVLPSLLDSASQMVPLSTVIENDAAQTSVTEEGSAGASEDMQKAGNALHDREVALRLLCMLCQRLGPFMISHVAQCAVVAVNILKEAVDQSDTVAPVSDGCDLLIDCITCLCPVDDDSDFLDSLNLPMFKSYKAAQKAVGAAESASASSSSSSSSSSSPSASVSAAALSKLPPFPELPPPPPDGIHPMNLFMNALPHLIAIINDEELTTSSDRAACFNCISESLSALNPLIRASDPSSPHTVIPPSNPSSLLTSSAASLESQSIPDLLKTLGKKEEFYSAENGLYLSKDGFLDVCCWGGNTSLSCVPSTAGKLDMASLTVFIEAQIRKARDRRHSIQEELEDEEAEAEEKKLEAERIEREAGSAPTDLKMKILKAQMKKKEADKAVGKGEVETEEELSEEESVVEAIDLLCEMVIKTTGEDFTRCFATFAPLVAEMLYTQSCVTLPITLATYAPLLSSTSLASSATLMPSSSSTTPSSVPGSSSAQFPSSDYSPDGQDRVCSLFITATMLEYCQSAVQAWLPALLPFFLANADIRNEWVSEEKVTLHNGCYAVGISALLGQGIFEPFSEAAAGALMATVQWAMQKAKRLSEMNEGDSDGTHASSSSISSGGGGGGGADERAVLALEDDEEMDDVEETNFWMAKENAVSALMKVNAMYFMGVPGREEQSRAMTSLWLANLPLSHDSEEAEWNHKLFLILLQRRHISIIGGNDPALLQLVTATLSSPSRLAESSPAVPVLLTLFRIIVSIDGTGSLAEASMNVLRQMALEMKKCLPLSSMRDLWNTFDEDKQASLNWILSG